MGERTIVAAGMGLAVSLVIAVTIGVAKKALWVAIPGVLVAVAAWVIDWVTEVRNGAESEQEDAEAARTRILDGAAESMGAGA